MFAETSLFFQDNTIHVSVSHGDICDWIKIYSENESCAPLIIFGTREQFLSFATSILSHYSNVDTPEVLENG